jgi:endonuclease/exonuclease/phosphatase (EEP) superfamily protein YafD
MAQENHLQSTALFGCYKAHYPTFTLIHKPEKNTEVAKLSEMESSIMTEIQVLDT